MSSQVRPIPSGFHTLTPHLVVKGASKAIEFYKKAFGAEEVGRLPGPDGKSIIHADLKNRGFAHLPRGRDSRNGLPRTKEHRRNARHHP
jgi:uncharacterized glyoxalase superfamily protein PhnB